MTKDNAWLAMVAAGKMAKFKIFSQNIPTQIWVEALVHPSTLQIQKKISVSKQSNPRSPQMINCHVMSHTETIWNLYCILTIINLDRAMPSNNSRNARNWFFALAAKKRQSPSPFEITSTELLMENLCLAYILIESAWVWYSMIYNTIYSDTFWWYTMIYPAMPSM